ncbi:glycine-rich protein-like [Lingula anatina]|uniref:Glycine-rich protein-like n=2 Tax=Lingula anatina TaxID=7574 RepID=A0A1S3I9X1_LINAN|nr:glycine-rich protein-like [Lingula anatina]|eukprot:XP_013395057.1 glycine-rich protein-like [Lingula anatina]
MSGHQRSMHDLGKCLTSRTEHQGAGAYKRQRGERCLYSTALKVTTSTVKMMKCIALLLALAAVAYAAPGLKGYPVGYGSGIGRIGGFGIGKGFGGFGGLGYGGIGGFGKGFGYGGIGGFGKGIGYGGLGGFGKGFGLGGFGLGGYGGVGYGLGLGKGVGFGKFGLHG